MTTGLNSYKSMKVSIAKANQWMKHFSATGRESERCRIHSIGANPDLSIQYTTGGQNYWKASQEAGDVFVKHLNAAIERQLVSLCREAIADMEKELSKYEAQAKDEYKQLFNEEMSA